ncbi:MAG: MBL fold metallo-hydrolase [Candidatus Altiarchaeia archaeon]
MASITFLGTGGGRFVVLNQRRYSGGLFLDLESKISLDPGPGALIRALQFKKDPQKLDGILVSHHHIDHYNDAEILVEAMTHGMRTKRGVLVLNKGTLDYVSSYHKSFVELIVAEPEKKFSIGELEIECLPTMNHEDAVGFRFNSKHGTIICSSDTAYSKDLAGNYKGAKVLILNTIVPASKEIETHLNTRGAASIIKEAKPEVAITQHFGMTMLNCDPAKEAKMIEDETGVRTIAARDGMELDLDSLVESMPAKVSQSRLGSY